MTSRASIHHNPRVHILFFTASPRARFIQIVFASGPSFVVLSISPLRRVRSSRRTVPCCSLDTLSFHHFASDCEPAPPCTVSTVRSLFALLQPFPAASRPPPPLTTSRRPTPCPTYRHSLALSFKDLASHTQRRVATVIHCHATVHFAPRSLVPTSCDSHADLTRSYRTNWSTQRHASQPTTQH